MAQLWYLVFMGYGRDRASNPEDSPSSRGSMDFSEGEPCFRKQKKMSQKCRSLNSCGEAEKKREGAAGFSNLAKS